MVGIRFGIVLLLIIGLLFVLAPFTGFAQEKIHIRLHESTPLEKEAQAQLERILDKYELDRWIFTDSVLIQSYVIPHSHPVLTLNTRYTDNDNEQLSTFLHEQIHWYADADSLTTEKVIDTFRGMYDNVPVRGGEGARSEYSTYLHLLVCWLEFDGLRRLIGEQEARSVLESKTYYKWIYNKVLTEEDRISAVIKEYDMVIE